MPSLPYMERNPYFSPGMQDKYALYYVQNLPYVAGAVRDFVDKHSDNELDVDEGGDE